MKRKTIIEVNSGETKVLVTIDFTAEKAFRRDANGHFQGIVDRIWASLAQRHHVAEMRIRR